MCCCSLTEETCVFIVFSNTYSSSPPAAGGKRSVGWPVSRRTSHVRALSHTHTLQRSIVSLLHRLASALTRTSGAGLRASRCCGRSSRKGPSFLRYSYGHFLMRALVSSTCGSNVPVPQRKRALSGNTLYALEFCSMLGVT